VTTGPCAQDRRRALLNPAMDHDGAPAGRTVYRSADARSQVLRLYDDHIARWPVAVDESDVSSRYGSVHVLSWGPVDGRPVLLLHAASMAATSWAPNAAALAEAGYRCHAPDHIGEAGKSQLKDVETFPRTPVEIGELYVEVAEALGLGSVPVVGASAGGHAAMRLALVAPECVSRLALLGPMGITSLGISAIVRMMLASLVPTDGVARMTSRWALGDAPSITEGYGDWFATALRSVASPPRVGRPVALTSEEMARIRQPVLLLLGDDDNLVGHPGRAVSRATSFPSLRVETLSSGHLIGVERAKDADRLLVAFLQEGERLAPGAPSR
jgi:pimeloyl-ACP methyl ester carboxylesterase